MKTEPRRRFETFQTAFRLPVNLLEEVDRFARDIERNPDTTRRVTRTDAVRMLIARGLEAWGGEPRHRPRRERAF